MLGIIDRYILRETLKTFVGIFSVLTLILISHAIMKLLQPTATVAPPLTVFWRLNLETWSIIFWEIFGTWGASKCCRIRIILGKSKLAPLY